VIFFNNVTSKKLVNNILNYVHCFVYVYTVQTVSTIFVFPTHVALLGKCSSMYIIMHIGKGGGGECLPTTQIPAYPTLSTPLTRIVIALVRWKTV
jgi:hypothetical protein